MNEVSSQNLGFMLRAGLESRGAGVDEGEAAIATGGEAAATVGVLGWILNPLKKAARTGPLPRL